jgi:hypothetical protein
MTKNPISENLLTSAPCCGAIRGFKQVIERDCELIGYLARDGRGLINATPMKAATT